MLITDKTRLLMLNSPSNPTGAVYPVDALESLATGCRRKGCDGDV